MSDVETSFVKGSLDIDHRDEDRGIHDKRLSSQVSTDQGHLVDTLEPHDSYEGKHRWDPTATWTPQEEAAVVRKTDFYLLTWICIMFFGLQLGECNGGKALIVADAKTRSGQYPKRDDRQSTWRLAHEHERL